MGYGLRLAHPREWRLDDDTIDLIGEGAVFTVTLAVGWVVMIWGWGPWIGSLLGWIPAMALAVFLAQSWRMVIAGGASLVLVLMMMRVL